MYYRLSVIPKLSCTIKPRERFLTEVSEIKIHIESYLVIGSTSTSFTVFYRCKVVQIKEEIYGI